MNESATELSPRDLTLDEDGYLLRPRDWNEAVAEQLARWLDVAPLTGAHWKVVRVVREHYLAHGTLLWMSHVCHEAGLDADCIHHLFRGPDRVWKIAGLPNPGAEARSYFHNEDPHRE